MTTTTELPGQPGNQPNKIEAVFFDFGGVFIDSPFAAVETAAGKLGLDRVALADVIFGPYETDSDHPWHRLERGEISFDVARAEITAIASERGLGELDPIVVLAEMGGAGLAVREFMVEGVAEFRRRGLRTGIITNNIAEFGAAWRSLIAVDELFDDIVDSSAVGMRKPDRAIFELACARLEVEPAAALFVDDHQGNVDGALVAGMAAVCCGYSIDSTRSALDEMFAVVDDARS